ncbi:MAG: DedA family protein [bacterium]|nr:DedA family protein [bacterium]
MFNFLAANIENFSYLGIFGFLFLSSVGLPAPEEVILIIAGYLVSIGLVNIWGAMLAAFLGVFLGDNLAYHIGFKKGEGILRELLGRFKISSRRLFWTKALLDKYCVKAIFFSRFLLGVRFLMPYTAGAFKLPRAKFIRGAGLAALIWVPGVILLSFYFSQALDLVVVFKSIKHWIYIGIIFIIGFIAGIQEFKNGNKMKLLKNSTVSS